MKELRGKHISIVFQDPMTYLNPVMKVGDQVAESISLHFRIDKHQALKRTQDILERVGIAAASSVITYYPHQLSGGMRQRILISMAISCEPDLLIADEPTTALDVTVQAQIIELLKKLKDDLGVGLLLITHDLGVVADICDKVCVMYAGEIVEEGAVVDLYNRPLHPYTQALLGTTLSIEEYRKDIVSIGGNVPSLVHPPLGCRFHPRCPYAFEKCKQEHPITKNTRGRHVACWLHQ
jgi:oligopeptide/dipeptide ABC transporter ATP-binding protein